MIECSIFCECFASSLLFLLAMFINHFFCSISTIFSADETSFHGIASIEYFTCSRSYFLIYSVRQCLNEIQRCSRKWACFCMNKKWSFHHWEFIEYNRFWEMRILYTPFYVVLVIDFFVLLLRFDLDWDRIQFDLKKIWSNCYILS